MIAPGIDTGGGGLTDSSNVASSLESRLDISARIGGNRGIQFADAGAARSTLLNAGALLALGVLGGIAWKKFAR